MVYILTLAKKVLITFFYVGDVSTCKREILIRKQWVVQKCFRTLYFMCIFVDRICTKIML